MGWYATPLPASCALGDAERNDAYVVVDPWGCGIGLSTSMMTFVRQAGGKSGVRSEISLGSGRENRSRWGGGQP